jgi:hypothetical protein
MDKKTSNDFKLERYKYILKQIHSLNENIHKYLALFQGLLTAIIGGGIAIFVSWKKLEIDAITAKSAINALIMLFLVLSLFIFISIFSGILSWFDYRKEEVKLLNEVVGPGFRNPPTIKHFWRWYETYILLFIICISIFIYVYINGNILETIK